MVVCDKRNENSRSVSGVVITLPAAESAVSSSQQRTVLRVSRVKETGNNLFSSRSWFEF